MIHGPFGKLNFNSPCMIDGKYCKRYPQASISNTVRRNDGYPLYRRSAEDGGKLATAQMWNGDTEVDDRKWTTFISQLQISTNSDESKAFFTLRQTDAFAKLVLYSETHILHTEGE
ncbi:unnamed protein product [Onchocerca ochengi]|uniref:Laminin N-terminal domain-containing protein n=1 Tax=Onchocerca ochengi TaxID=42157 RepID=A0A182EJV2_ONCOC|nr:unnamed protein product [Onchocerca ochengi]